MSDAKRVNRRDEVKSSERADFETADTLPDAGRGKLRESDHAAKPQEESEKAR